MSGPIQQRCQIDPPWLYFRVSSRFAMASLRDAALALSASYSAFVSSTRWPAASTFPIDRPYGPLERSSGVNQDVLGRGLPSPGPKAGLAVL